MSNVAYVSTGRGWSVRKGRLAIHLADHTVIDAKEKAGIMESGIFTGDVGTKNPMSGNYWRLQTEKLIGIAEGIVSINGRYGDVFDHLPITKSGKWPKNGSTVLAMTGCEIKEIRNEEFRKIPYQPRKPLQLRLIYNETLGDTALLQIGCFPPSKQKPVFDMDGTYRTDVACGEVWLAEMAYVQGQKPHETVIRICGQAMPEGFHFRDLESDEPFTDLSSKDIPALKLKKLVHK